MLNQTKHLMTEVDVKKLPRGDAEVTFLGRSNVGKSSFINALCQKKDMARVSQVPGKTRTINIYEVKRGRFIVDLPGYGHAVGSWAGKADFGPMLEAYLTGRPNLVMVFVIIDTLVGPTKLDIETISWLKQNDYPYTIIANKIDRVGTSTLESRKKEIALELVLDVKEIFWVSSKKKMQVEPLQRLVAKLLGV